MKKVPEPTIRRLFYYYRCLNNNKSDIIPEFVCSDTLGEKIGIKSTLLRRDLSFFGHMGRKGKGYNQKKLKNKLEKILGLDKQWNMALIGAGNLGKALLKYGQFKEMGFYITEIFDNDLDKIGRRIDGKIVKNVRFFEDVAAEKNIKIVIIATDEKDIEGAVSQLKKTDIKAVWNFTSTHLDLENEAIIVKEDLCCSLGCLIYNLNK